MATAKTPFPIHGKLGKLIFYVRDGKQFVREKPDEIKFHQGTPAMGLNRKEFGGAAKIALDIYRNLRQGRRERETVPQFMPYAQNHLTSIIKKGADRERKARGERFCYAESFRFHDTARAIAGIDLGQDPSNANKVQMLPIGPLHNPDFVKITGLEHAAESIGTIGSARLEFRFQIRQTRIQELQPDAHGEGWKVSAPHANSAGTHHAEKAKAHSTPSDWIPAAIIPDDGFTIPIPKWNADAKYATCIVIEWRELHPTGRRIRYMRNKAIIRIATLHAPVSAWPAPKKKQKASQKQSAMREADHPAIAPLPKNPAAYIQAALQRLQT
jgi:hypothetical protein